MSGCGRDQQHWGSGKSVGVGGRVGVGVGIIVWVTRQHSSCHGPPYTISQPEPLLLAPLPRSFRPRVPRRPGFPRGLAGVLSLCQVLEGPVSAGHPGDRKSCSLGGRVGRQMLVEGHRPAGEPLTSGCWRGGEAAPAPTHLAFPRPPRPSLSPPPTCWACRGTRQPPLVLVGASGRLGPCKEQLLY